MKRLIILFFLACTGFNCWAAGDTAHTEHAGVNVFDTAALQRGAALFTQYCLGCHAAEYVRYQRLADDLGLNEDQIRMLMPAEGKVGDTLAIAMDPASAERWLGKTPPDLSLVARSRSEDWLFTFFKSFYRDPAGGWNNALFPDLSMPHALWQLQGIQEPVYHTMVNKETGVTEHSIDHLQLAVPGKLNAEEYAASIRDLVAFLSYIGEPARLQRSKIGWKVLLFLAFFAFLAYLLKAEYWRDVH